VDPRTTDRRPARPRRLAGTALLLAALALGALLAACGGGDDGAGPTAPAPQATAAKAVSPAGTAAAPAAGAFPRTVTDASGPVTLRARPARIVSFSPGATEVLFAIGAGPQVVAVDRFSDFPAATKALPQLQTYLDTTDPEKALAHRPDLIVTTTLDQAKQYRALGVAVVQLAIPGSIDGVYADIRTLGTATGRDDAAAALVAEMQRQIGEIVSTVASVAQGPRVYIEIDNTLYTAAPSSFVGGMLDRLKGRNIAAGTPSPFPQLTAEAVIAANPDVILLTNTKYGESAQSVAARPGWSAVAAVRNGRIVPVDPDVVTRPGPRVVEAVQTLARALYPDRFAAAPAPSR